MFRSVAGVAQTELDYGFCCIDKTSIFFKNLHRVLDKYLIYVEIIYFVAQTTLILTLMLL